MKLPFAFRSTLKMCETHWFAFVGDQVARVLEVDRSVRVLLEVDDLRALGVPAHEDPVLPGDLLEHVRGAQRGLRLGADRRAVDRLAALRVLRVRAEGVGRAGRSPSDQLVGPVGVQTAVTGPRVVGRAARGAGRQDAAAALIGGDRVAARVRELGLVVEVDVLIGVERGGRRAGRALAAHVEGAPLPPHARKRRRTALEPLVHVEVVGACALAVDAVDHRRGGAERRRRAGRALTARQRRAARLVVERVGGAATVEDAAHVELDQRAAARAREPVARVDLELVAPVDGALVCVSLRHHGVRVAVAEDLRLAARALGRQARARREVHARRQVDHLEAVEVQAGCAGRAGVVLVRALAGGGVHAHRVRGHRVGDVRPARVHVHRVRLADVARHPDHLGVVDVGHIDDLEPALRCAQRERSLVVAASGRVGRVYQDLRVAPRRADHVRVQDRPALGARLDVVLETRRLSRAADAGGRGMVGHRAGLRPGCRS